jgi:hypothetical protein
MKRIAMMSMAVLFLAAGLAVAHHSYGDYDRNAPVSLEGTLTRVLWANPHVVLTLETREKGEYRVEWGAVSLLARQGIDGAPVKQGDHVIVTGSVNRDPEKKILTLVLEIRRPADGWHWAKPGAINSAPNSK